jgi:hypothetical protein
MAQPTRSGRITRQNVMWEASQILDPSARVKKGKKGKVQALETRPASADPPAVIQQLAAEPQPDFIPPVQVASEPFYIR